VKRKLRSLGDLRDVAGLDRDDLEATIEVRLERENIARADTDCSW
jgi:hypothetical protein